MFVVVERFKRTRDFFVGIDMNRISNTATPSLAAGNAKTMMLTHIG